MDLSLILAYGFGLLLIYVLARLLFLPMRLLASLVYNALVGGVVLFGLNIVGGFFGLHLALNPLTALLVGLLGVPGVVLLLILQRWP